MISVATSFDAGVDQALAEEYPLFSFCFDCCYYYWRRLLMDRSVREVSSGDHL
jgi:hypothetical protein